MTTSNSELVKLLEAGIPMRDGPLGKQPDRLEAVSLMKQAAARIQELSREPTEEEIEIREALELANEAINIWVCTYADDMVAPEHADDAKAKIAASGGTLMYTATVQSKIQAALRAYRHGDEGVTLEKPLFVPLRAEWYRGFESGEKTTEYRAYGPRWNDKTCRIGRPVVLAYGYGWPRMERKIVGFKMLLAINAPKAARDIFPDAPYIAAIEMGPR